MLAGALENVAGAIDVYIKSNEDRILNIISNQTKPLTVSHFFLFQIDSSFHSNMPVCSKYSVGFREILAAENRVHFKQIYM